MCDILFSLILKLNLDKSMVAMVIGSFYSYGSLNVSIFNKRIAKQMV